MRARTLLVTGATGTVGSRLVPLLLARGHRVRCFVRDRAGLRGHAWSRQVEVVEGDALDPGTLPAAVDGVETAYYLIHSLDAPGGDGADLDVRAAENVGRAAGAAGVDRIVYLGGLAPRKGPLPAHLESRVETGVRLRSGGVDVTEFRAAQILGAGSLSFELLRHLTEKLPVLVCPPWIRRRTQPIALGDVLDYLVQALGVPESRGRTLEIGGADVLTHREAFEGYARCRDLHRLVVEAPALPPALTSLWASLVTPLPASVVRALIEGIDRDTVVRDAEARALFDVEPVGFERAVRLALAGS